MAICWSVGAEGLSDGLEPVSVPGLAVGSVAGLVVGVVPVPPVLPDPPEPPELPDPPEPPVPPPLSLPKTTSEQV